MKNKILALLLILTIPLFMFAGCGKNNDDKINMNRYFSSCSYTLKTSSGSITGNLNSYFENKHSAMNKYSTITFNGDSNWLYAMSIDYMTFEIYSAAAGEFELQITMTNVSRGDNETDQTPDKVFDQTFSWNVEANTAKAVKIEINDKIKSITADTILTFIFTDTPNTTYTIQSLQLYGAHR